MEDYEKSESLTESEENDKNGVGRMYECRFCKRGFTNAQALGGHMNIHRKDKAKARQNQNHSSSYSYSSSSSSFIPHRIGLGYYPFANTFNTDTPLPLKFSSQPSLNNKWKTSTLFGVDLSLKINSSSSTIDDQPSAGKQNNKQNQHVYKNNDVDLELRLGYNP